MSLIVVNLYGTWHLAKGVFNFCIFLHEVRVRNLLAFLLKIFNSKRTVVPHFETAPLIGFSYRGVHGLFHVPLWTAPVPWSDKCVDETCLKSHLELCTAFRFFAVLFISCKRRVTVVLFSNATTATISTPPVQVAARVVLVSRLCQRSAKSGCRRELGSSEQNL